jgi:glycosyltransferase involved in cell wall biosynthesis
VDGLRVLHVIDSLGAGGAERSLAEMLPHFDEAGVSSTVVCLKHQQPGIEDDVRTAGHDVRILESRRYVTRALELRRVLGTVAPDLIHTTLYAATIVGRLAALAKPPVVLTSLVNTPYEAVRGGDPRWGNVAGRAVQLVDGFTARHLGDHFHAITPAVKAAAVRDLRLPAQRITVVERGRDTARLGEPSPARRHAARVALGFSDADEVVVSVGRQEFQKGHEHLLAAVPELLARRPGAIVLIAGKSGQSTQRLRAMAADHGDRVRLLGHRDDVPEILAAADVFAFPSLFEGLGGSVLEALALGVPVVASDLDALDGVIDHGVTGVRVPPADPAALAVAIGSLLEDRPRAVALGEAGRRRFLDRFTLEHSVEGMLRLYRDLAGSQR